MGAELKRGSVLVGLCLALACGSKPVANAPAARAQAGSQWPAAQKQWSTEPAPSAPRAEPSPLLTQLTKQLQQAFAALKAQPDPVHYLGYQVTEQQTWNVSAADASLLHSKQDRQRLLDVDLRVGTPERDNTHRLPGEPVDSTFRALRSLPLEDEKGALKTALWLATDEEYEQARQQWMRVLASEGRKDTTDEDPRQELPDFSKATAAVALEPPVQAQVDRALWEQRLVQLSALARSYPDIMHSAVHLDVTAETRSYVNSEGSQLQSSQLRVRLSLEASTLSSDGMPIERFETLDLRALQQLPTDAELATQFTKLLQDVRALRQAPLIDPYAGPAILDGRAAGVFFHEIFGHRIEGHRQDDETEGQTFAALIGQQILSQNMNIYDDPSLFRVNGVDLNGFYRFDDEGVRAQRAQLVQRGTLQGFLMSRAPARDFLESNGHGRRQPGHAAVARQANLVVDPERVVTAQTLKQALLSEVKRQGLPYGLRFSEITGGFTQTTRSDTQAFKVIPVMVYRVHPDGREELVRGVDMEGTPLTALSKILLAGNDFQVFNGLCGAESGWVPVSAVSPSLLISQIEVARQEQTELRPPLLPPPSRTAEASHVH